jgi:Tol biopolymer transport system component
MTPERWRQITEVFHVALTRDAAARARYLEEACADDGTLREDVEAMLAAHAERGDVSLAMSPRLAAGTMIGPYRVADLIGSGGMGEVYKAIDTNLKRAVAIKVLPASVLADAERLARFQREAEVLGSLNHPNIAVIHGLERSGVTTALVMELVEGPTLADRLARGALVLEEALPIAKQIAEALEAAHERQIVHRDLKPANIKLPPDGLVKVLDFGLAKAMESPVPSPDVSQSPTITTPVMTQAGMLLGTAAYMSPEQARGMGADKRSDVWGFGCVLYEMLTGRQAFHGEGVADTVGAVIHKSPDWTALPSTTPPAIRTLLRRCLEKDRRDRIPDIGMVRIELQDVLAGSSSAPALPVAGTHPPRVRLAWAVAGIASVLAAAGVGLVWFRPVPTDARVYRSSILPVDDVPMAGALPGRFALSPDGRQLAFTARRPDESVMLWVRSLEDGTVRRLGGTEGATGHFWSPDSRFLAFNAQGQLKKVAVAGGPPIVIATAAAAAVGAARGAWSKDDVILFSPQPVGALYRVPATGGEPVSVTVLDRTAGDTRHWWPSFLPDGRRFLYLAIGSPGRPNDARAIYIGSVDQPGTGRLLMTGGANARYAQGHVLFMRDRTLMGQPFDAGRLELVGAPSPIAEQVVVGGATGTSGAFSVSDTGVLVYQSTVASGSRIMWLDRSGKEISVVQERGEYGALELSPDGKRAVVSVVGAVSRHRDLWILDLTRNQPSPFTLGDREETAAVWSSDGARLVFNGGSRVVGPTGLFVKLSSGAGSEEPLLSGSGIKFPSSWSHDARFLLYGTPGPEDADVWILPLDADRTPKPFMQTTSDEGGARFSPDGRWVAYGTNQTGQAEIFVTPFPETGERTRVSTAGALLQSARWRGDGRELFYLTRDGSLMAAEVDGRGREFRVLNVKPLFRFRPSLGTDRSSYDIAINSLYDVIPDGQTFLVNAADEDGAEQPLSLMINWTAALRRP